MSEFHSKVEVENGSERSFAIVFAVVFAIIGLWPLLGGNPLRLWALALAAIILAIGFFAPKWLEKPNKLWFKFGLLLGMIIAPIVMALVFLTTFLPIGLILRLSGKDLLKQRLDPEAESYWIDRTDKPQSMQRQF